MNHLIRCSEAFLLQHTPPWQPTVVPFDRTPLCPTKDLFGRAPDPQPRAYEPVWPMPLAPIRLTYDLDSLNRALSCVQMYLELRDSTYWTHVMVRKAAFPDFLKALDEDEGRMRTLPFSCWCDAGPYSDESYNSHRHLIVVAPSEDHFEQHLRNSVPVPLDAPGGPYFLGMHERPLRGPLDLVNALGYLSRRDSLCPLSLLSFGGGCVCPWSDEYVPVPLYHYFIFESLPKDYALALAVQWEGGLEDLLNQKFREADLLEWLCSSLKREEGEGQWQIPIRNIPGIPLGKRLPLTKDFQPSETPTDYVVHLLGEKKVYFERRTEATEEEKEGPVFFEVVGEEVWTLNPSHPRL